MNIHNNSYISQIAIGILIIMAGLLVGSVLNDSATMDELAHIPAGVGYITEHDYRLNPEHPPLIKALSGLSVTLFARPFNFPTNSKAWAEDINGQWDQGRIFLYESGNDADNIIFWARFPIILLALLLGWLLFAFTKKRFGNTAAIITLIFFAFSPTVLAHSRYVTTDLGASFGFFIGIIAFIWLLEKPTWKNTLLAGILFGIAMLFKFSLVLLLPMYVIMLITWIFVKPFLSNKERMRLFLNVLGKGIAGCAIGVLVIWAVYTPLIWNYPQARQLSDSQYILGSAQKTLSNIDIALIKNPITRPLGEYLLGFIMVSQRASGGNTAYFLGNVSNQGTHWYFPILYFLKEPLSLHILTLFALFFWLLRIYKRPSSKDWPYSARMRMWIYEHFVEFSSLVMIAIYWASSIWSPLNIGIRHVLPTFPFIYMLVGAGISSWLSDPNSLRPQKETLLRILFPRAISLLPRYFVTIILLVWFIFGTLATFPYFLSYYNELAGGTWNGYKIATDSNYDWGQDLKRLKDFANEKGIENIAIDYFGGGNPTYYFGNSYREWHASNGVAHGWFAISAGFQQESFGTPVKGFNRADPNPYGWLKQFEPVARAGTSIFIYNLP